MFSRFVKKSSALVASIVIMGLLMTACPSEKSMLPDGYENGKGYLVEVEAWHETDDKASMMNSLLYENALIDIKDEKILVTAYFISGTIMGIPVYPNEIEDIRYLEGETYLSAETNYDFDANILSFTFAPTVLTEYTTLKMDFSGEKTLRLKIDITSNIETDTAPSFSFFQRTYEVPLAVLVASAETESMMAPLVEKTALLAVNESTFELSITIIAGSIQPPGPPNPVAVDPSQIIDFQYKNIGQDNYTQAIMTFDETTNTKTFKMVFATNDINALAIIPSQVTYQLGSSSPNSPSLSLSLAIDEKTEIK